MSKFQFLPKFNIIRGLAPIAKVCSSIKYLGSYFSFFVGNVEHRPILLETVDEFSPVHKLFGNFSAAFGFLATFRLLSNFQYIG